MSNFPTLEPTVFFREDDKSSSNDALLNIIINPNVKTRLNRFFYSFSEEDFSDLHQILKAAVNTFLSVNKQILVNETEIFVACKNTGMLFEAKNYSVRFSDKIKEETLLFDLVEIENQSYY
jgi:hypothetical protein